MRRKFVAKFVFLSLLAIFAFFIPIRDKNCIVVLLCTELKNIFEPIKVVVVLSFIIWGFISSFKKKDVKNLILCVASLGIVCMLSIAESCAVEAISLAFSISITVFVSGTFSILITESGLVEFVAIFLQNFMKRLLKVPGYAAMDIITSFFASSSVGVFVTNQFYRDKKYTKREAGLIASNFSVVSFGFLFGIISMLRLESLSNYIILAVVFLNFLLGMIMGRIFPISKKPDVLIDGTKRDPVLEDYGCNKFLEGLNRGIEKSKEFSVKSILATANRTLVFCREILIQVIPIYFFALVMMVYTDVFEWLGSPFELILKWLQIPDAEAIAPTTIIGILEVSLPAVYLAGKTISVAARFFVAVLSLVQIIFFTETANAILESDIPLNVVDLLMIFMLRTILTIPLLALIINTFF